MNVIEHERPTPIVISREAFDRDYKYGYVALEYNPERIETIKDSRSGREIRRTLLADINYRCMDCQFDTLDKKIIDEHRTEGNHPWAYGPFQSPYGHIADAEIEGIEDYQEFLTTKEK